MRPRMSSSPRLERVDGVGAVWLFGGQEREVQCILDYPAMTPGSRSVRSATRSYARTAIPRGATSMREKGLLVRTLGQFTDLKQIEMSSSPPRMGTRLRAQYRHRALRPQGARSEHPPVWRADRRFGVVRRTGANTVEVMRDSNASSPISMPSMPTRSSSSSKSTTKPITSTMLSAFVTENFYEVSFLTIVVLLFFLRSFSRSWSSVCRSQSRSSRRSPSSMPWDGPSTSLCWPAWPLPLGTWSTTRSWCWRTSSGIGKWANPVCRPPWTARLRFGARFWPRR